MARAAQASAAKKPAASARKLAAPAKRGKVPAAATAKPPAKAKAAGKSERTPAVAAVGLKQLAAGLAESHEMPKRQVEAMLGEFVETFAEHLTRGTKVRINGLGIFQVRTRAARLGRNPATGEQIQIKASKKIAFRPAKELKEAV